MEDERRTVVKIQVVDYNSIFELRGGGEAARRGAFGENNSYLVEREWNCLAEITTVRFLAER